MANIAIEEIKRLRSLTGVGITDAKQALVESGGDFDKALEAMRKKGLTKAEKRSEREARAGIIGTYNHDNRIGVLIEVNCESEFVAKTEEFITLVKDVAMHIAASAPEFVSFNDIDKESFDIKKREFTERAKEEGKPDNMLDKIVDGMLKKHFAGRCLLDQPFVRDTEQTVGDYIKTHIATLGENIVIRRFSRMVLGEVS